MTDLDTQTYQALADHIETEGYPPSIRELGKRLGLTSPDSVRERLLALEAAGWIERGPGARQIRLLNPSGEPLRVRHGEVSTADKGGGGSPEDVRGES